jgi:hypothetical protein
MRDVSADANEDYWAEVVDREDSSGLLRAAPKALTASGLRDLLKDIVSAFLHER